MNTTNTKKICAGYQPIPGYTLEELIGRGGFGEVWRADAPGGLKKAVKFVFGSQQQSRASRELKSLERIKGVHHPFLLTLERFEIVDDQLVIVTELADGSLEDVFNGHREHGSCGIPRDALLSNLHDAADALDYLHQNYRLQHLDIKPGNLLMMGGHVKVADFGLLKDLNDIECSVVGGLTPIYAPPEVFDGRPSVHSDQYSLAVMYQELLTGTRPFNGRTIAQLATQHVHSAPNLTALPASDRPVTARALEKDPSRRFPNCMQFVESLRNPHGRRTTLVAVKQDVAERTSIDDAAVDHRAEHLPQLNGHSATNQIATHHSMVVALGGMGADCLRELRSRAADVQSACLLDLHGVLIDTDIASIHSMRIAEISDRVPPCQTIHIPLRSSYEYRQNGTDRLKSVSRRWIYNVPRSGSTEGMRPLGRLALVDHGPEVVRSLAQAVGRLSESTGDQTASVYLVGSISGGTSSGIYLDVVHLLRHLLDDAGLEETRILSMLATGELRADPASPIALHDTHAAILEMQHFLCPGHGYPGDAGAHFKSVPAARTPLHDVYLVAAAPFRSSSPSPARTITDYVWADATGAAELLAEARGSAVDEQQSVIDSPTLRSVGIIPLGISRNLEQTLLVPSTVRHLLFQWLGLPSKAKKSAVPLANRLMRRCAISRQTILDARNDQPIQLAIANLKRELSICIRDHGVDVTTAIESLKLIVEQLQNSDQSHDPERGEENVGDRQTCDLPTVDLLTSDPQQDDKQLDDKQRGDQLARLLGPVGEIQDRLDNLATTLAMGIALVASDQSVGSNPWDDMPDAIRGRFKSTVINLHDRSVARWLLNPIADPLVAVDEAQNMVAELSSEALRDVAEIVDRRPRFSVSDSHSISTTISDTVTALQSTCNAALSRDSTPVTQPLASEFSTPFASADGPLDMEEAIAAARPTLLTCGGKQRLILIVGTEDERQQFEPQVRDIHNHGLTVSVIPGSAPKLIHEIQGIETKNVIQLLSRLNAASAQVTTRLVTRTDVSWQTANPTSLA